MPELILRKYPSLLMLGGWLVLATLLMANCKWE